MSEERKERWEKIRAKGRAHFIWFRGVLLWGVMTAIFWSAFMALVVDDVGFLPCLVTAIILFPVGGYFWGVWVWKLSERKYLQTLEANDSTGRTRGLEQEPARLKGDLGQASKEESETGA